MQHVPRTVDHLKRALADNSVQPHRLWLNVDDLVAPAGDDR
jgi:hypothetical protein